jgi:hypothetical protein
MIWRSENSYPQRDFNPDPSVVQPKGSRYTDYALLALQRSVETDNYIIEKYNIKTRQITGNIGGRK